MSAATPDASGAIPITLTIDGQVVQARAGETIFDAAIRAGHAIPHLCHKPGLRPDGNCRACVVEVEGERTLSASCCRSATHGMVVRTNSPRARHSQRLVLELLLADQPAQGYQWNDAAAAAPTPEHGTHGELSHWAQQLGVPGARPALTAGARSAPAPDRSHPAMTVQLDACIQCTRCVRACREEQGNGVIGLAGRGGQARIVFDLDDPMGASSCVACGECVQACPTGALSATPLLGSQQVDRTVESVCPFCGIGCRLSYQVRDERIVAVQGIDGPANDGRLCVKGRFGFDYVHHAGRLTRPLVRRADAPPKDGAAIPARDADWRGTFREATWAEALALAGDGLRALRDQHGPKALAGFGSAKGSNEEAYLFQKLVRTGFGSNNVDHCTRLCHASSVAALLEGVGSGAVSNPVRDVEHAELIFVIGSNPTANHPVGATWMKNAVARGARLVLADPRATDLAPHAWRVLQFRPDTDVALLNAMLHTLIDENLVATEFVATRAVNMAEIAQNVAPFSPEAMAPVCGIPAATIREVARAYATARSAMILWGMGVSQHVHGTDNVRCLIALCTLAGQLGRPGTGLHPLRGQNNVQGASDAGLIPMMFPNYQRVDNADAHRWFEAFWGMPLDTKPGYTVVEIMHKMLAPDTDPHKVRGLYVMGENPAMSDPDLNHTRHALASLQHLVVQDIFMTETAWLADVILPASAWPEKAGTVSNTDRTVQLGRQAIAAPGDARPDLWIVQELARRMGLGWNYGAAAAPPGSADCDSARVHTHMVAAVYEEMRQAMHGAIAGITWERLLREGSVTYPCLTPDDPGHPIVFTDRVPTPDGRIRLVPAGLIRANEAPDADYPFVLITGRQLEHWHTGAMTRRATVLDALEPEATASLNGQDLARLGVAPGDWLTVRSRRGTVRLRARQDDGTAEGNVFIPFAYAEAAANLLTNPALDPFGKIPEFKYCAVAVARAAVPEPTA